MALGGVAMWFVIWGSIVIQIRISIQMSMCILIGILYGVFDFSFYHTSNMKYDVNMSPVGVSMVHLAWISMRLNIILDMIRIITIQHSVDVLSRMLIWCKNSSSITFNTKFDRSSNINHGRNSNRNYQWEAGCYIYTDIIYPCIYTYIYIYIYHDVLISMHIKWALAHFLRPLPHRPGPVQHCYGDDDWKFYTDKAIPILKYCISRCLCIYVYRYMYIYIYIGICIPNTFQMHFWSFFCIRV